jgi:hypothetical protein
MTTRRASDAEDYQPALLQQLNGGASPAPRGYTIGTPDPYKRQIDEERLKKARSDNANAPIDARTAAANARHAELENEKLDRELHGDPGDTMGLPRDAIVQALIDGRMAPPAGAALRSPYWQGILGDVAKKDPSFDLINYGARNATRKDFTSGKSAMNIKALNTALGHLGTLYDQIGGTTSIGGYLGATTINAIGNAYSRSSGDPGITNFESTTSALAGELTAVYRGAGGAEADIKRYIDQLSPSASLAQKRGSIQNIANLLKSRLDAIGDQYSKGMGASSQPLQILDHEAQSTLAKIDGKADDRSAPPWASSTWTRPAILVRAVAEGPAHRLHPLATSPTAPRRSRTRARWTIGERRQRRQSNSSIRMILRLRRSLTG